MKHVYGFSEITFLGATTLHSILMQANMLPLGRTNAYFESYNFSNGSSNLLNQNEVFVGIWKGPEALTYT
jgi:hypothetical protein